MKIAWYSNAPWGPTGYGTQTAMMLKRLTADGHELSVMANWGQQVSMGSWEGIPVYPQGLAPYSIDVVDDQAKRINPDYIITLYDVWPLTEKPIWTDRPVVSWTPVDHYPPPPKVVDWAKTHDTIAMSRFGQKALADMGVKSVYIPHGIERTFLPTPSDIRKRMSVPGDAFLVVMNQANIGNAPPRKAWDQNIQAMADFMRTHHNVYLYIHSDIRRPGGVPIDGIAQLWGLPMDRLRLCDQTAYRLGVIDAQELAQIYSAADVMLACSMGEGFGLTPVEAGRCGTPSIVTNFSAQPEVVGDTGWKVAYQLFYDQGQHAALATPLIRSIREALEDAFNEHRTVKAEERRRAVIKHTDQYDADFVYEEHWRPYLGMLEERLRHRPSTGIDTIRPRQKQGKKRR